MRLVAFVKLLFPDVELNKFQINILNSVQPTCFGEYPLWSVSQQAENDCHRCPFNHTCFEESRRNDSD